MSRAALLAGIMIAVGFPAAAQTAVSTAGDVGSAALRNGYPAVTGAAALPSFLSTTPAATTAATATTAVAPSSSAVTRSSGVSTGGGGSGTTATSGSGSSGGNWVLCPPSGSSGLAPLFTGTDLSCAPD